MSTVLTNNASMTSALLMLATRSFECGLWLRMWSMRRDTVCAGRSTMRQRDEQESEYDLSIDGESCLNRRSARRSKLYKC